jgi:citrate lyase beta subunit
MIDPVSLGATLYVPATRQDMAAAILQQRKHDLRSVVICLEDSIHPHDCPQALVNLAAFLQELRAWPANAIRPAIFIRPRSAQMLAHILGLAAIECVDGFVIPKATADSMPEYMAVLSHDHHMLMPTLETREVFDPGEMRRLRDQLLAFQDRILAIRIGGNDLLQTMRARRSAARTSYDGPLGPVIVGLVTTYSPWGFHLTAPVFEHFGNLDLLCEEVERDMEHGLIGKTAIHPCQIKVIQSGYSVDPAEMVEAQSMLSQGSASVFSSRQSMCEPATHRMWAQTIVRRAQFFGLRDNCMSTPQSA